jgi:hypothetical protein
MRVQQAPRIGLALSVAAMSAWGHCLTYRTPVASHRSRVSFVHKHEATLPPLEAETALQSETEGRLHA